MQKNIQSTDDSNEDVLLADVDDDSFELNEEMQLDLPSKSSRSNARALIDQKIQDMELERILRDDFFDDY